MNIFRKSNIPRICALLILLLSFPSYVFAQDCEKEIDSLLNYYYHKDLFNGCALVAKKGKIIFEGAYGYANREWDIPNTPDTKFRIASITKQFTAVLIMQLKRSGQLNFEEPIISYLPYFRKDIGSKINIYHLLTHTSGIQEYTFSLTNPDFYNKIFRKKYTPQEFIENFCSNDLYFEPGTNYMYSNANYYILGAIIEAITHRKYEDILKERILYPLGMTDTGIEKDEEIIKKFASGYNYRNNKYQKAESVDVSKVLYSAGAIYSTIKDLYLWDRALYTEKLLSKEDISSLFNPNLDGYACGFKVSKGVFSESNKEVKAIFHDGLINGFSSLLVRITNDEITIILLSNTFNEDLKTISRAISKVLYQNQTIH